MLCYFTLGCTREGRRGTALEERGFEGMALVVIDEVDTLVEAAGGDLIVVVLVLGLTTCGLRGATVDGGDLLMMEGLDWRMVQGGDLVEVEMEGLD